MIKQVFLTFIFILFCSNCYPEGTQSVSKIQLIQGNATVTRGVAGKSINAKVGTALNIGDTVRSYEESLVEIAFNNGEIVRLDENTILIIVQADSQKAASSLPIGRVWVNMKKIISHRAFDVTTPTAVAAIRGTIYAMEAGEDRSVDLSVYDGKVDVGPSEHLKQKFVNRKSNNAPVSEPVEVPGPGEIQGPHEVTLEQWKTIVAGINIKIAPEGAFVLSKLEKDTNDKFISQNLALDRSPR
jgi:hypothetical protein